MSAPPEGNQNAAERTWTPSGVHLLGWTTPLSVMAVACAGAWGVALTHGPLQWSIGLAAGLAAAGLSRRPSGSDPSKGPAAAPTAGPRLMVREVVPVWQRHLQASRKQAEDGVGALLTSFSSLSDGLSAAAQNAEGARGTLGAGVTDDLLDRHAGTLDALLAPMRHAEAQRERMFDQMVAFSDDLNDLVQQSKEVRQLASHTKLVAFNASIEAHRAGRQDNGFIAVAQEVQVLATRSDQAGQRIGSRVNLLARRLEDLRREAALQAGSDEELRLSARIQARQVIGALLEDLSASMQSSRELRELSVKLHQDMDQVFMGFQFQDRFNQMMDVIDQDMARLTAWISENDHATPSDAVRWLEELERTYTMEEQRSHHHGTVEIQRSTGVEFF